MYLTMNERNQFTFTCPIFDTETRMSLCVRLRNMVWRGENPEVRRGCQACMSAGKCPAAEVVRRIAFNSSNASDDYASEEPRKGKLAADILEHIHKTIVPEAVLQRFGVSSAERMKIETASDRIGALIPGAPRLSGRRSARPTASPAQKVTPKADKIKSAAATGDLSAALNHQE